jgi:hypothetical protein
LPVRIEQGHQGHGHVERLLGQTRHRIEVLLAGSVEDMQAMQRVEARHFIARQGIGHCCEWLSQATGAITLNTNGCGHTTT